MVVGLQLYKSFLKVLFGWNSCCTGERQRNNIKDSCWSQPEIYASVVFPSLNSGGITMTIKKGNNIHSLDGFYVFFHWLSSTIVGPLLYICVVFAGLRLPRRTCEPVFDSWLVLNHRSVCFLYGWIKDWRENSCKRDLFWPTPNPKWGKSLIFLSEVPLTVCLTRLFLYFELLMWLMCVRALVGWQLRAARDRAAVRAAQTDSCPARFWMTSLRIRALNVTGLHPNPMHGCVFPKVALTLLIWCLLV